MAVGFTSTGFDSILAVGLAVGFTSTGFDSILAGAGLAAGAAGLAAAGAAGLGGGGLRLGKVGATIFAAARSPIM